MGKANIVTIDGPAGSGKSTVAREAAKRLGFLYIDTGAMYRALTLKAMAGRLDLNDKKALIGLSKNTDIALDEKSGSLKVYLDKKDVSEEIRAMEVTANVKYVASVRGVRENMVRLQRRLSAGPRGCVLEGRDIGTVVFPDAAHKFYLDASFETRIKRRFDELKAKGISVSPGEVRADVSSRDKSDMARAVGPLKKAPDATVIDTTDMTAAEVADRIVKIVKK
jgi:cytidylate kinase